MLYNDASLRLLIGVDIRGEPAAAGSDLAPWQEPPEAGSEPPEAGSVLPVAAMAQGRGHRLIS